MKTIIFDFDGTIADSFKVAIEVAHELTHRPVLVDPKEITRLRAMRMLDVARELKLPKWQWPFLLIRGRRMMTRRLGEVMPFAGMPQLIDELKNAGYQLLVMSSNSETNVRKFLTTHKLDSYFDDVKGGVGLLGKARGLTQLMNKHALESTDCVYIGDEPRDIEGSHKVGLPCVAVSWGFNAPALLADHQPLAIVNSAAELHEEIDKWSGV